MSSYDLIYDTIRRIPSGKVASYGMIAQAAGLPRQARLVGYALHSLKDDTDVPWFRIVNFKGGISLDEQFGSGRLQRAILEREGVEFMPNGKIDMKIYSASLQKMVNG